MRAVVNLASGRYLQGQERLRRSLNEFCESDQLMYQEEGQIGAPNHHDNPYAFKIYGIQSAINKGYKHVLWLDASVWAIKPVESVWKIIEEEGYFMQAAGHNVGRWANDRCLEYFGLTRDEAMDMPMYGNAGLLGLNFETEIAQEFFEHWKKSAEDGIFKGAWRNDNNSESNDPRCSGHRHDMVCGSIIAQKLGMKYKRGDEWLQYVPEYTPARNGTIIFKAQGL